MCRYLGAKWRGLLRGDDSPLAIDDWCFVFEQYGHDSPGPSALEMTRLKTSGEIP
jgi:hypothetical protein